MDFEQMNFKEYVYLSLIGALIEPYPEVDNLFAEGEKCEKLYAKVYDASQRLCERLGEVEDEDLEIIVSSMLNMQREIALKMYEYGAKFKDIKNSDFK